MNKSRTLLFSASLAHLSKPNVKFFEPVRATDEDLLLFHAPEYVEFVRKASKLGQGFLDLSDTPCFRGIYEASLVPVGTTLMGLEQLLSGTVDHFFNPIGGLHHAHRGSASGFCVFNDAAIAIARAIGVAGLTRVAYVDIDAHHGDGVYYGYAAEARVLIADVHEDGRYLFPGTGDSSEEGSGAAIGTKLNIPLPPSAGDDAFVSAFDRIESFLRRFSPGIIFLQCGADGLRGDPLTHLSYSSFAHSYATRRLHSFAHEFCEGRILAMGGGGYNPANLDSAWMAVIEALSGGRE